MKKSILDSIPGIWPVTKKKILKNYGSLEWLKEQKKEDIERLLGQKITETLEDHGMI
jgi:excinuclease UvrABC nuclease subunit